MLQPTIFSPLAQWALGDESGYLATDRSGNGRNLTSGSPSKCPDLRFRNLAIYNGANTGPAGASRSIDASLQLTGALTLTARVWTSGAFGGITEQTIAGCLTGDGETEPDNILYALQVGGSVGNPQLLRYKCESGAGVDFAVNSSLELNIGQWYFVALRRNSAADSVTLTLGDVAGNAHEILAATPPSGGTNSVMKILSRGGSQGGWQGGVSDVCIWDTELSDETLETLRAAAMTTEA